jgi:hypothetical protein
VSSGLGRSTVDLNEGPESYCRALEAYLCRKNEGHLIRIVGPAFEQVCGWAARGIPVKVAERGIDRYFDRYYAKGPRRRPIRIEFCEADVFDVFDEWRRAVGLPIRDGETAESAAEDDVPGATRRHGSLPAHLERVIARLTTLRSGDDRALDATLDAIVRELDLGRAGAKALRGDARALFLERLRALDAQMIEAARAQCDAAMMQQLERDADAELAPFRERMPAAAYEQSRRAAVDRLIRERRRLPVIAFE